MNKKLLWLAIIALLVIAIGPFVHNALAGGGPGPECGVTYSLWPATIHGNPGEDAHMQVSNSCSATATVYWNKDDVTVVNIDPSDLSVGPNDVAIPVPANVAPDIYKINLDSTNGTASFHREVRLAIGNLPELDVFLTASIGKPYWASYSNYESRILSVDLILSNVGHNAAYAVWLGETVTNGVELWCNPFNFITESLPAGENSTTTRFYHIPPGVSSFRSMLGVQFEDPNANVERLGYFPPEA